MSIALIGAYGASLITIITLDLLWLGVIAVSFYQTKLAHLLAPSPNWVAAAAFYLLFAAGVLYFAVLPSEGEWGRVLLKGALLGILAYGTYDLTNHATLRDWPLMVTIDDMLWGAFITGAAASAGYCALKFLQ